MYDYAIVGAGFAGAVLAERIASQLGKTVLVVDKRAHIAGNAFDVVDEHGFRVHKHGPHVFHTNHKPIVDYLGNFTGWRHYEHQVRAVVDDKRVPLPVNANTINQLYGLALSSPDDVAKYLASVRDSIERPQNAEEHLLSTVGRDLYEKLFKGYTEKQWGVPASHLCSSVVARVGYRTNTDDRYFTDKYQFLPSDGYARMFENMLAHPLIEVVVNTAFSEISDSIRFLHLIYTGPIDCFFDYEYGRLPYRSVNFEHEHHDHDRFQEVGTINYPNEHRYTRITEWKHLTGQERRGTTITYEYPALGDENAEPYYPVPTRDNHALYQKYQRKAAQLSSVTFCGRLAEYRYYNMDQVVGRALHLFSRRISAQGSICRNLTS